MFCLFRYESMGEVGEKCREQAQKVRKKLHSFFQVALPIYIPTAQVFQLPSILNDFFFLLF